jgi:serine/threonine protein kinase
MAQTERLDPTRKERRAPPTVDDDGRPKRDSGVPPQVAGYTLVRVIGRGGMGIVWEAFEHRLDRKVALKVQAGAEDPERVAAMWSEARIAANVSDPGVVPVHDFGHTVEGDPFYTMDLVEGTDLRALMREGPMATPRALEFASQIASAVGAAHERGIVHRDLKPSNVLVDASGRARVVDFGLAFDPKVGDTHAHELAGTPGYMAPEQISGEPIVPATDVHAIGVMLYEMLAGKRPWEGEGLAVLEHIMTDPPVPLGKRNPALTADVEEVCMRCIARAPEDRFRDARALANALDSLRLGKPVLSSAPPRLPTRSGRVMVPVITPTPASPQDLPSRDEAPTHYEWRWKLASPPEALWPYVANTDRVNRAVGLQAVSFTETSTDGGGGPTRHGAFHVLGMNVEWREFPFEWSRAREHSVFRQYRKGPIEALWNRVRLEPMDGGGTELVHEVWLKPRGLMGRVAAYVEIDRKTATGLDRLYRRIDDCLRKGNILDPFEEPCDPGEEKRRHVEAAAARLIARGFDEKIVARLGQFVLCEPAKRLERMRPFELADQWGVDRAGALDLFLHATYTGLLDLSWEAICPRCRIAHEHFPSLDKVARTATCVPCGTAYERDLAESVEIVFRPHPELRDATPETYCIGAPALRPHVLLQQRVAAGEKRIVAVDLPPGDYRIAADWPCRSFDLSSSGSGFLSVCDAAVRDDAIDATPRVVRAGEVSFAFANETDQEQVVRVEVQGARDDAVTAAIVMTHPAFRELFNEELLAEDEPMGVRRMAFLCIEVEDRATLFAERGDAGAWTALRRLDAILEKTLRTTHGVLVPAPLGVYAVAFSGSGAALEAALAVQAGWRSEKAPCALRAAIHEGPCIAISRERRTEYFGRTVHRAVALLEDCPPGGIALSDGVASERDVARRIHDAAIAFEVTRSMQGPYSGLRIAKLRLRATS